MVCLIASCDYQMKKRVDTNENPDLSAKNDSTIKLIDNSPPTSSKSEILELPLIGSFELAKMKIDSLNKYGAGDCGRIVRRYSMPNVGLAIDSMTCGEYGFTYSYYLLSDKDFIQAVYTKKSSSVSNPKTNSYFFVQQERVVDFNSVPATSKTKVDTISDYTLRENPIDKKYSTEILKDKQITYEYFEMEYKATWEIEMDY